MSTLHTLPPPYEVVSEMRRFEASLEEALGRDPTDEELAVEMALPACEIAELRNTLAISILPPTRLDAEPQLNGQCQERRHRMS